MRVPSLTCAIAIAGLAALTPATTVGQDRHRDRIGGPLTATVVGAPFSAEAITIFTGVRADGTQIHRTTSAEYYRDSAGRVRVELIPEGAGERRITVQPQPGPSTFLLDGSARNARLQARSIEAFVVGGGNDFSVQIALNRFLHVRAFSRVEELLADSVEEDLGRRGIAGGETLGRRRALSVPAGYVGNDQPIKIVDERWESPELRLVIESRYSDTRIGTVEYRLTNIRRHDPPSGLFVIPADYQNNAPAGTPLATFSAFERFLTRGH
jgi:hypothetical protein